MPTRIPSHGLRWFTPAAPEGVRPSRRLQQRFTDAATGKEVWEDVPEFEEATAQPERGEEGK